MPYKRVSNEELTSLVEGDVERVRNICIVAHVDHGKTTLTDHLISSNGIISERLAGKVKFMDAEEDEQIKGITMKSSAVALAFDPPVTSNNTDINNYNNSNNNNNNNNNNNSKNNNTSLQRHLIHVIDSPGHVDFSSEVSAGLRLCDGAVVVVDVAEGVLVQTETVLRQAVAEGVVPCLVLNKIDRLFWELHMEPVDAYRQLQRVLVHANATMAAIIADSDPDEVDLDKVDSDAFFSPISGNVVFASAADGWGFRLHDFGALWASRLGVKPDRLRQFLWGEYYLHPKTKRVHTKPPTASAQPLFVQLILSNIWNVYRAVLRSPSSNHSNVNTNTNTNVNNKNTDGKTGSSKKHTQDREQQIERILSSLNIELPPRTRHHRDPYVLLHGIMHRWLPLATAVLDTVVAVLPNPRAAQYSRAARLMPHLRPGHPLVTGDTPGAYTRRRLWDAVSQCRPFAPQDDPEHARQDLENREEDTEPSPVISSSSSSSSLSTLKLAFVAKMMEPVEPLPPGQRMLGFARVYAGTLRPGDRILVLRPRYQPPAEDSESPHENKEDHDHASHDDDNSDTDEHWQEVEIRGLYLLVGRGMISVSAVPAGHVCGIAGLDDAVVKSATLASSRHMPVVSSMYVHAKPVVRIAVEPHHPFDMPTLANGLQRLVQADPCVEVLVQETGEHVILCAGEVHAERCLRELRRYTQVELHSSAPLVSFRETIIRSDRMRQTFREYTANRRYAVTVSVRPLPQDIAAWMEQEQERLRAALEDGSRSGDEDVLRELKGRLQDEGKFWNGTTPWIWSAGPRRSGPNLLVNGVPGFTRENGFRPLFKITEDEMKGIEKAEPRKQINTKNDNDNKNMDWMQQMDAAVVSGFQIATSAGPLCGEPMYGVCFIVENVERIDDRSSANPNVEPDPSSTSTTEEGTDVYGPVAGQMMSAMSKACRRAFVAGERRLVEPVFQCEVQARSEVLGAVYAVLSRRRATVTQEHLMDGYASFTVSSLLPVAESFGFSDELRGSTSGSAAPQLMFSHWAVLDVDPFFVPTTEEELEEYGDKDHTPNLARDYINAVRKRKGIAIEDKIVAAPEKQRTLSKNK